MITVQKLKIVVFIKSFISIICILGIIYSHNYFTDTTFELVKQEKTAKSNSLNIEKSIDNFNKKTADIADALNIWDELTSNQESFQGLKISTARDIIENLNQKYKFAYIDINMSKPELLSDEYQGDDIGVEHSVIKIKLRALSDVHIYHFMYDLQDLFPGYLIFKSYLINSESKLNAQFISRLKLDDKSSSVSANIELNWRELKEL